MFKNHPWFGVGVDRYGAYFKEFRDKQYPLNYGFDITSTNAHNVPIQIFATAGIFAGIAYLLLISFVFYCGLKGIRKFEGSNKVLFASIFAAWLAYQAQSIISIDNIGIAVWGWLLAGVIVGVYAKSNFEIMESKRLIKGTQFAGTLTSGFLVMVSLVLIVTLYQGEYNMFQQRARYNPQIAENREPFHQYAVKTLTTPLVDPYYKMTTGAYLVSNMYVDEGMKVLLEEYKLDPRNLDNLGILADFSLKLNQINDAIKYRKEIYLLDPWNAKNLLELGRLYKATGQLTEMSDVLQKILAFAPNTPEATSAKIDLI
jgi:hypothetical protein